LDPTIAPTDDLVAPKRAHRWPVVAAVLAIVAAGLLMAGWSVRLPFYAFSPGPVGNAVAAVEVGEVSTYQLEEELLLLTVSSQEVNPLEALIAGFDPTVDLVRREAVRSPDESDEDFVARNQANMDISKDTAITLALTRLGYEVVTRSDGVLVIEVVPDLPVADVLAANDVITALQGEPIELPEEIGHVLSGLQPGDNVQVELRRGGLTMSVSVELAASDDDPGRPIIGISAAPLNPRFEYPFRIDIDAGLIGGPSAGMMYTLAVLEVLAPESLVAGHIVAGTGTIDADGNVGAIGGIRQKVVAAEAAGAELMLVPALNYDEALTAPRNGMELIPVATLDEALTALAAFSAD
jgi:PDZ domain-containing protein